MSKIIEVIKDKNRIERLRVRKHREELDKLKSNAVFRANLKSNMRKVELLLNNSEVDSIIIEVLDNYLGQFGEAIYSDDLSDYDIKQVENEPNKFYIKKKYIQF